MKKTIFTKVLAVTLVAVMALGTAGIAFADTVAYATQAVNVRNGPGTSYSVIGELSSGEQVSVTGNTINGWVEIYYTSTQIGYVQSGYLSAYATGIPSNAYSGYYTSSDGSLYYTTTALNIRSGPGTNYSIIGTLAKGDYVTRIGQSGKWYQIATNNGVTAYVSSVYLKSTSTAVSVSTTTTATGVKYATTSLNVRSGPSTKYSIIGALTKGQAVTIVGTSGNWSKIIYNGTTAYAYSKYLSTAAVYGSSSAWQSAYGVYPYSNYNYYYNYYSSTYPSWVYEETGVVGTANMSVTVRTSPSDSASVAGVLYSGSYVVVISQSGDYYYVYRDGSYGYVSTDAITLLGSSSGYTYYPPFGWGN